MTVFSRCRGQAYLVQKVNIPRRAVMTSFHLHAADPISRDIWEMKYQLKSDSGIPAEDSIEATWQRVARALASVEPAGRRDFWEAQFRAAMENHRFLPAGRIL